MAGYINWNQLEPALEQLAGDYIQYAIAKLKANGSYNTGRLAKSIRLLPPMETPNKISLGVSMLEYGFYVDSGAERKAGKRPPIKPILEWIKEKRIRPQGKITQTQLAFAIARTIGSKGQRFKKAKPFINSSLRNALDDNMQNIAFKGATDIMARLKQDLEQNKL
ncbi:MAG: hypothetical protein EBR82_79240 [Caulobacteraceae bacterium]|nr:hypothetical protein [Caulobacteraceae bacterium]